MTEPVRIEPFAPGTDGIRCPKCNCPDVRVTHTRPAYHGVRRYRTCRHCGCRFSTIERRG